MKKVFRVTIETDTVFPHDLYNASDFQESFQEEVDSINEIFPDTPRCKVTVEEEPVVSLSYLQAQENTTPPHIQEVIDARVLQDGIKTPDEIRRIL